MDSISAVTALLEELGYRDNDVWIATDLSLGFGKYSIKENRIRLRSRLFPFKCAFLKINGQRVHIHGIKISCVHIDLADPWSLDYLRNVILNLGKSDDYQNRT